MDSSEEKKNFYDALVFCSKEKSQYHFIKNNIAEIQDRK